MSWLDKLMKLFPGIKGPLISVNITKKYNVNISGSTFYDKVSKVLNINLDRLTDSEKKELRQITKEYVKEGSMLLENQTSDLLERLYQYNMKAGNKGVLSFFTDVIPTADFESLEASLFLRAQFMAGNNISKLKQNIRTRFGDRGNNIANLCTAGYFEEFLMPLYNNSKDMFGTIYEEIVSKSLVAVFVHQRMQPEDIPTEISKRIGISKKYGIKFIHIHGISKKNVEKIKQCIDEQKAYFDFFKKTVYETEDKDLIIVELLFN